MPVKHLHRKCPPELTWAKAVENYLTAQRLLGRTAETLTWYQRRLGRFVRFMQERYPDIGVAQLNLEHVCTF